MKHIYLYFIFIISFISYPQDSFGQEEKGDVYIIFIKDFSAKDYYSLQSADSKTRVFTILEACIPMGLLAISYDNDYDKKQAQSYTETIILKLIRRKSSYTSYKIEDLRDACSEYRKENSDD